MNLDPYSVEDTKDFIKKLETEIIDLKQQIKRKQKYIKVAKKHLIFLKNDSTRNKA